jgi:YVTN family beta-propeller protein
MKINRLLYFLAATALGAAHADGPQLKAVQHPMSELHAIAKFSIPGSPDWVAIGDSVWISNNPKNNISLLDAKTNQVGTVITVAKTPCSGLAIAFGSVWVPICSDGSVERVDAKSRKIVASIPSGVANTEGGITAGEGSRTCRASLFSVPTSPPPLDRRCGARLPSSYQSGDVHF